MEKFCGIIQIKELKAHSKSDGRYVYLYDDEGEKIYRLSRKDVYPIDDAFFFDFENQRVCIIGQLLEDEWLQVFDISIFTSSEHNMDNEL